MTKKKEWQSIFVIFLGFIFLFFAFQKNIFLIAAACVGISSLLSANIRGKIVASWFQLAKVLGFINSRILLSILFFLVLLPLAWLSRLFSIDKLQLKRKTKKNSSYFIQRDHQFSPKDFEEPW